LGTVALDLSRGDTRRILHRDGSRHALMRREGSVRTWAAMR
jgi:hypothetical protein